MKYLILLCLSLFLCHTSLAQFESQFFQTGENLYVMAQNGLNMRSAPELSADKLRTIPLGQKVKVIENSQVLLTIKDFGGYEISDYWYKVQVDGKEGYVFGGYLSRFPAPLKDGNIVIYLDEYVRENFSLLSQQNLHTGEGDFRDCMNWFVYEEGLVVTQNYCGRHESFTRYIWEDARLEEVAAMIHIVMIGLEGDGELISDVTYKESEQTIIMRYDLCEYIMTRLSAGGVMLVEYCYD